MDGNFVSEHLRMQNPEDDVFLADGHGFMVEYGPYEEHIKASNEIREASKCNDHKAVNNVNRNHAKNLDATGIGACACGRHGCFFPHCVVDFQKGERSVHSFRIFTSSFNCWTVHSHMNMDYSFTQALRRCEKCKRVCHYYDVNCNFWLHFLERCLDNEFLKVPENLEFFRGIGLFHVHGHQNECYPRFAPSFIPGAGLLEGEIIETLWVGLNEICPTTRNQSKGARQETLDVHMNDSNWKKLVRIGR